MFSLFKSQCKFFQKLFIKPEMKLDLWVVKRTNYYKCMDGTVACPLILHEATGCVSALEAVSACTGKIHSFGAVIEAKV